MNKTSASLTLKNISYSFNNTPAVKDFSLEVKSGSFTTLLGPSGCGKTTLLRIISGFLTPDKGLVLIDGQDQANIPAEKRRIGMVFQDYALFPHMSVKNNLLYGLKIKNRSSAEENMEKVLKTASMLDISDLLERYPHELSGGQQQRAALGRVIVMEPKIILMDEPLSALDSKLRETVREELKEIQKTLAVTTVYVTHDQEEALSLSDTIAVIKDGILQQTGSAHEIYFNPVNLFTAEAVGKVNALSRSSKKILVRPEWFKFEGIARQAEATGLENDTAHDEASDDGSLIYGTVLSSSFLGNMTRFTLRRTDLPSEVFTADLPTEEVSLTEGNTVRLSIKKSINNI